MRFITPQFDDEQKTTRSERQEMARRQQAVRDDFARHCGRPRQTAPEAVHRLQDMDISDGQTRFIVWEPEAKRLRLYLRCGNLQVGYFDLNLRFEDVEISQRDRDVLRLVARQGADAEIQAWEADFEDTDGAARFVLRLQWSTRLAIRYSNEHGTYRHPRWRFRGVMYTLDPEVEIRFAALDFDIVPVPPSPPSLFAWRRRVPDGRRDRRLWLSERREEREERRGVAGSLNQSGRGFAARRFRFLIR